MSDDRPPLPRPGQTAQEYIESQYEYAGHVVQGHWCLKCWSLVRPDKRIEHWKFAHGLSRL